jgi:hypothetical protein
LPLFFDSLLLLFYCFARAYSLYLRCHFSSDLGMPPSISVSWAFMPFFSHGFLSFLIEIFSCLPMWGVILVEIFFSWKKNYLGSKRDHKGCTYFRTWKE